MSDLFNPEKLEEVDDPEDVVIPVALPLSPDIHIEATDPVQIFAEILELFGNDDKWLDATLKKVKVISNTKVGSVGQLFIEKLCEQLELKIEFPMNAKGVRKTQSPWDVRIAGVEFELKTATEDTSRNFQFNHIRYHRPYEALLCLGVSPENLYFEIWTKADVTTGKAGRLVSMEKNANASFKLTKTVGSLRPIAEFEDTMKSFAKKFQESK